MTLSPLRPYQNEMAGAILHRVVGHLGGAMTIKVARQGGKNEVSSRVELTTLLLHANTGGSIIKAAPTLAQANISRNRLRMRARDAGVRQAFRVAGPETYCGRARHLALSAEPGAMVVGNTADLLLEVDEAQDVLVEKFDRDFRPMAASTNAAVVYYGTPWAANSLLEQAESEARAAEKQGGPRRVFRFDWEVVAACVPDYAQYVESERKRLGESHPLFRTQYLLEVVSEAGRLFDPPTLAQLRGTHARLRAPKIGERYVAGLDIGGPARQAPGTEGRHDFTVLTIGRVTHRPDSRLPIVEVVEVQSWQGEATESLIEQLADRLRRVWRIRHVSADATGLGGPMVDLLTSRLAHGTIEPFTFSEQRKSQLGFGLLAAAKSGRLRIFSSDNSPDFVALTEQTRLARAEYRDNRSMGFDVDPSEGHDDHLMSLALLVQAATAVGPPRVATGTTSQNATPR